MPIHNDFPSSSCGPACAATVGIEPSTATYFDGLKLSRRHKFMFFLIVLGTFFDQMDLYNMSFVGPALLKNWGMTMGELASINSIMIFTMLFGGLFGGYASDRFGRKTALLTGCLIFSIFSICNGLAWNYYSFLIFRTITGFGIAMLISTEIGYVTEITPSNQRGKWFSIVLGVGLLGAPITAWVSKIIIPMFDYGWRIIFFLGGAGFIVFILGCIFLIESPRWLVAHGKYDKAKKNFKLLTGKDLIINPEDMDSSKVAKGASYIEALSVMFNRNYIKQTTVVTNVFFFGCAGAFMFISWAPTLLTKNGMSLELSLQIGSVIAMGMPLGGILSSFLTDKGGRKLPLGGAFMLYGICGILYGQMTNSTMIMVLGFVMAASHIAGFSMISSYGAESYPTRVRGTAYSLVYMMSRIGPAIGNLVVPLLFASVGYTSYFMIVGGILLAVGLQCCMFGLATAGRNLEEMHEELGNGMAFRVREVLD
ncbi:MFS transporter [Desulfobulbus sp.]|uniref:MFS transporter n=1 Tax=Desulfobulbus sp. TaxID=895 RepID=UPI00286F96DE|nr:MFS transporter [Desulfobulbus sp.]